MRTVARSFDRLASSFLGTHTYLSWSF